MYNKFYIGIDNGVSGTIGLIATGPDLPTAVHFVKTPVKSQQNYTKKAGNITRVNGNELLKILKSVTPGAEVHVMIERPMVNPKMFQTTISAVRALEATQTIIETLSFPYSFLDSKEWQKAILPVGSKGEALKEASLQVAQRLYPGKLIKGHKDADGLLIAHYCMLKNKT